MSYAAELERIERALREAAQRLQRLAPALAPPSWKSPGDPLTAADTEIDALLRERLPRAGEGWLSEETADRPERLACRRVWVVDPIDGTRELVAGIPEWCVSIGLVEDGQPVAGGIANPATGELFLGAVGAGLTAAGAPARIGRRPDRRGALVLASRTEVSQGAWSRFAVDGLEVRPMGSVAYKLARVAAGLADATFTLVPKHEWDVAAGVALIRAAGGAACAPSGAPLRFNRPRPRLDGLVAANSDLLLDLLRMLETARPEP